MPELPEVETLKRYLIPQLIGRTIIKIVMFRQNLRYPLSKALTECFGVIKSVTRFAKYLVIKIDNDHSLIFHLGMSGRLTVCHIDKLDMKHDHVILYLDNSTKLVFNDYRRFGMIYYMQTRNLDNGKIFKDQGIEPLLEEFNVKFLRSKLINKMQPIKNALMDNKLVVGIGNIYASESLHLANINPTRAAGSLSEIEIESLISSIKAVLLKSIEAGGTTLRDFVNCNNEPGYFKQHLRVYGRNKQSCYNCNDMILKIKQAGRATFYCLNCQK